MDLPKTDEQEESIQNEQEKSSEQLDKKQNSKASESQKKAAEQMEQLAFQMQSAMQSNAQEQQEEDMDALRQLLENIVQLSFDQEGLMEDLSTTATKDPRFIEQGRTQRKLRDDAKVIEDSLFALSKRVPQLQSIVNREMNAVNGNMDEATRLLGEARANERYKPMAADKQQHAMTSLNNLALLLDEALQQMMAQMNAQGKPGSGSCNKPGGSWCQTRGQGQDGQDEGQPTRHAEAVGGDAQGLGEREEARREARRSERGKPRHAGYEPTTGANGRTASGHPQGDAETCPRAEQGR